MWALTAVLLHFPTSGDTRFYSATEVFNDLRLHRGMTTRNLKIGFALKALHPFLKLHPMNIEVQKHSASNDLVVAKSGEPYSFSATFKWCFRAMHHDEMYAKYGLDEAKLVDHLLMQYTLFYLPKPPSQFVETRTHPY